MTDEWMRHPVTGLTAPHHATQTDEQAQEAPVDVQDTQKAREERFWKRVAKGDEGCWTWLGTICPQGYGRFRPGPGEAYARAHVFAYKLLAGTIPDGLVIDHLCRNRACVNPEHLEPVTSRTNVLRGVGTSAVNARKTECIYGHPFSPENTYLDGRGRRQCRECRRTTSRARARRRVTCPMCEKEMLVNNLAAHKVARHSLEASR